MLKQTNCLQLSRGMESVFYGFETLNIMIKQIESLKKYNVCRVPVNEEERTNNVRIEAYNQALIDAIEVVKNCSIPDVGQSLPDAEQCLKIQEQVKQYCYTDQDDNPLISSGGIRAIISRWKH